MLTGLLWSVLGFGICIVLGILGFGPYCNEFSWEILPREALGVQVSNWAKRWILIPVNDSMSSTGSHERKGRYENNHSETYNCRIPNKSFDNEQESLLDPQARTLFSCLRFLAIKPRKSQLQMLSITHHSVFDIIGTVSLQRGYSRPNTRLWPYSSHRLLSLNKS